jgi:lysyl-tRNA synthetase class 2
MREAHMFPNWLRLKEDRNFRKKFVIRSKILSLIRDYFLNKGFLEVETPSLVACPGMEPNLDLFKTNFLIDGNEKIAYFVTSPEYAMKKLLVAGFPKIFQICRSYRNGEISKLHNPEFTILEWYRVFANYKDIMADVENLIIYIARHLHKNRNKKLKIKYQGNIIDLSLPWTRLTMKEAFRQYARIDLDKVLNYRSIAALASKRGYVVSDNDRFDDIFFKIFLNEIEPHLGKDKPTILMDWPAQMAALSKRKFDDPRYAERFEIYIAGLELGNAFSELNDPKEQFSRLKKEKKLRKKLGKDVYNIDKEFIQALEIGMPPAGGIAMGVDRLVMLFTNSKSIEEVLFFPAKQIFGDK